MPKGKKKKKSKAERVFRAMLDDIPTPVKIGLLWMFRIMKVVIIIGLMVWIFDTYSDPSVDMWYKKLLTIFLVIPWVRSSFK